MDEHECSASEEHILELAAIAADRAAQARAEIDRDGITVAGRYGPRLNPAIPVERDARAAVLAHLRALGVVNPAEMPIRDDHTPGPKPRRRRP